MKLFFRVCADLLMVIALSKNRMYFSGLSGSYAIFAWIGLAPFFLMFVLPFLIYGGNIRVRTVRGVYTLPLSESFYALTIVFCWLSVLVGTAFFVLKFFPKDNFLNWPPVNWFGAFKFLTFVGLFFFLAHNFFIFPPAVENLVHILGRFAYCALGLGIWLLCVNNDQIYSRHFCFFATFSLLLVLIALPISLGKASPVVAASAVLLASTFLLRMKIRWKVASILLVGFFIFVSMIIKNPLRQAFYEGGTFQRLEVAKLDSLNWANSSSGGEGRSEAGEQWPASTANVEDWLQLDTASFPAYDQNYDSLIIKSEFWGSKLTYSVARVVHRLNHLGLLGHVIQMTPISEAGFSGGLTYTPLLYVLIPRFIFPDKPKVEFSNLFGRRYELLSPDDFETTVNIDPVTEAWINGGWVAVLLSALIVGIIFGCIFGLLRICGSECIIYLILITAVSHISLFESESALILGGLIQNFLLLGVFFAAIRLVALKGSRVAFHSQKNSVD